MEPRLPQRMDLGVPKDRLDLHGPDGLGGGGRRCRLLGLTCCLVLLVVFRLDVVEAEVLVLVVGTLVPLHRQPRVLLRNVYVLKQDSYEGKLYCAFSGP